jgi:hypothetical protein
MMAQVVIWYQNGLCLPTSDITTKIVRCSYHKQMLYFLLFILKRQFAPTGHIYEKSGAFSE